MSVAKLQTARNAFVKAGMGTYLPGVKILIAAIDEHIQEDAAGTTVTTAPAAVATTAPAVVEVEAQKESAALQEDVAVLEKQKTALDEQVRIRKIEVADYTHAAQSAAEQVKEEVAEEQKAVPAPAPAPVAPKTAESIPVFHLKQ